MSSDLPDDPISASVPQDWGRLISIWIKDLQSAGRAEAIQGLIGFVRSRLVALAEYIDFYADDGQPQVAKPGAEDANEVERALFGDESGIADEKEFYQRAAEVMRDRLLDRLENLALTVEGRAARSSEPTQFTKSESSGSEETVEARPAKSRLDWWCEFHREAGKLPPHLLAVHDLMYYARRSLAETSAVLGTPVESVKKDKEEAVRLLRPLFDKGRGKA